MYERLCNLGFDLKHDEILTSLLAARQVLQAESLRPMLLVDSAALEDFEGLTNFDGEPDSVVV
ncbi:TIGR01458 family HAD-type hydrolase, partial [bacterium LRH843]|nr:TIGR01458 family HAD-type hydrolase [bacterium LRH843]